MEYVVIFEKKMSYTATINAKNYEAAEEKAIKMLEDEEEREFKAMQKNEPHQGWDMEAEIEPWELMEVEEE